MGYLFPWEIPEIVEDYYSGPCLFMALYRLYKNAYFGQGFQLSGTHIKDKLLKERIEQLPLDIKRIIFSKIWKKLEPKKGFAVKRGELLFDFSLQYLISQYGKLKSQTTNPVPKAYAAWTGMQILNRIYIFTYGPMNPTVTPLIPDFMCKEKINPLSPPFSLVCPTNFSYLHL
jgi:hypothetical protein